MIGKRRTLISVFVIGVASIGFFGLGRLKALTDHSRTARKPLATDVAGAGNPRSPYNPEAVGKSVEFWKAQAARDPQGALERRELAGAYLARLRENGDIADAVAAEQAARESLTIMPKNNSAALIRLSRSLLAQHRFPEALTEARRAATYDSQAGRLVADVLMELGDYEAAGRTLADSPGGPEDMNYLALRARLDQINGMSETALGFLKKAQTLADQRPDMPAEAVAWYHAMVGHVLIDAGKLDEGEHACRDALEIFPRDYRAMTSIADAAGRRGDWKGAIAWGEKAIAVAPQNPQALRLLGDAQAALGNEDEAAKQYKLLKELVHSFPRIYDRHWALFCADNGTDLDEALALARKDLELRKDVHAYDALAWVAFKKDLLPEAEAASVSALAMGTKEAPLLFHAGMIARASGDLARAKDCFIRAREINPNSVPLRWIKWLESKTG